MLRIIFYIALIFVGAETYLHRELIKTPDVILQFMQNDLLESVEFLRPARVLQTAAGATVTTAPYMAAVKGNPWTIKNYTLSAVYAYTMRGVVLGKARYFMGRETELSTYDLALGWQQMSDPNIINQLEISQSNRWWYYRYGASPPISPDQIPLMAGNMHIIAANTEVALTLSKMHKGNQIWLQGYLVNVTSPDGWSWNTATASSSEGAQACKLIWVEKLVIEK